MISYDAACIALDILLVVVILYAHSHSRTHTRAHSQYWLRFTLSSSQRQWSFPPSSISHRALARTRSGSPSPAHREAVVIPVLVNFSPRTRARLHSPTLRTHPITQERTHSFIHLFIHSFIYSFIDPSFVDPSIHSSVHSFA